MKKVLFTITALALLSTSLSCTTGITQEEYDRVKQQRDNFGSEVAGLIQKNNHLEYEYERLFKENQVLRETLSFYSETYGEIQSYPKDKQIPITENISLSLVPLTNPNTDNPTLASKGATEPIVLINNKKSTNPTYAELLNFLKQDKTDTYFYNFGGYPMFTADLWGNAWDWVEIDFYKEWITLGYYPRIKETPRFDSQSQLLCGDFAELLHNNAELAGIRTAFVSLIFDDGGKHALGAFKTTDRGLVFVDSTGEQPKIKTDDTGKRYASWYSLPNGARDKIAHVALGDELTLTPITGSAKYQPMPRVKYITLQWD